MKKILYILMPFLLISCNEKKEIKSPFGAIDIISNIYMDASQGLDNTTQFHISKINYIGDDLIELVPNLQVSEIIDSVYYIKENMFYRAGTLEESEKFIFREHILGGEPENITTKNYGAVWLDVEINDYKNRKDLKDTTLYDTKHYKRFEIKTEKNYSVFYIYPTDTILPYSLNKIAERDYKGRIERIDSYDREKDLFSTMWLIPRKKLDEEALTIFDYNKYIDNELEKRKKIKK